jgi:hypothetical protein
MLLGWRIYFYSNEGDEPIHVHCQKGNAEAKYWIDSSNFDVIEVYSYNMNPSDKRNVRKILFNHLDYIIDEWNKFQEIRNG